MSEESQNDGHKKSPSLAASNEALSPEECGSDIDPSINNSYTQMTASSVLPDSNKWQCELCTYENFRLSRKCTMCRTPKSSLGEDIFKLQDGASALPTEDVCEAEEVAERLKPLRISSPQGQAGASSVVKWACLMCTYENWPRAVKCAMCGAAPASHHHHQQQQQQHHHQQHHTQTLAIKQHPIGINDIYNGQKALLSEMEGGRRAKRRDNTDWLWLQACLGVVEDDARCVEEYLSAGGDPARALQLHEVALLDRASAFDVGHTLVHLAIRFQRQEILTTLLSRISGGGSGLKRSPSYVAPDLAASIRRHVANSFRCKKSTYPCRYINEFSTFTLPAEIEELPGAIQEQLLGELVDGEAACALEAEPALAAGARLLALWNRSAGDCLPDAVCQAAYGVSDRANALRAALADALRHRGLYARWAAWERLQAAALHYTPEEGQLRAEWARLASAAARPGAALHQLHVFALAHVLRRPLLVYGADVVRSFRGEALGYARFRGLYLPLLWEPAFCSDAPLCLAYTRGHFSALVPWERGASAAAGELLLPLAALPVPFLCADERADEAALVRRWLRVRASPSCPAAAVLRLPAQRPLLQAQMLEEWLNHYRRLAQQTRGPFPPRLRGAALAEYCSDADTDEE